MIQLFNVGVPVLFWMIMILSIVLTSKLPTNRKR